MKKITASVLMLFTFSLTAMDSQVHEVAKLSYEQVRFNEGMKQLLIGAPFFISGAVMCYQTIPNESNKNDYFNFFRSYLGAMFTSFGMAHLAYSCDDLVCNDDECKANCIKFCKIIYGYTQQYKQD